MSGEDKLVFLRISTRETRNATTMIMMKASNSWHSQEPQDNRVSPTLKRIIYFLSNLHFRRNYVKRNESYSKSDDL